MLLPFSGCGLGIKDIVQYTGQPDKMKNCPMTHRFQVALVIYENFMKNLKSGHDIGKIYAHNFSASICFAWFLYVFPPVIHGKQRRMTFLLLYMGHVSF